ncbi:hypothetical protein ACWEKT_20275 [Nocardia takedensis]|uniref:hypothetical protein n=1 Tax=Nocardia takedensis TaxID=259390 RepID=UPI0003183290|nr:hypothetical protein [Nocardia takedensis]
MTPLVQQWTGAYVVALRAARRMSLLEFSAHLGVSPRIVSVWEAKGAAITPRPVNQAALDRSLSRLDPDERARFLEVMPDDTGTLTEARSAVSGHPGGALMSPEEDEMRRRTFGTLAVAAATTSFTSVHVGATDVARIEEINAQLERDLQQSGGAPLVERAAAALDAGLALVENGTYSQSVGRRLMCAVGDLATQTGWLAYDADLHALARKCFTEARSLAGTVDHDWLTAYTCLTAALQPVSLARTGIGSASRALPLVARAADAMRRQPPSRIHALIAVREAAALGVLGDADGFGRAITTAWRELERAEQHESPEDCPAWLRFVGPQEIRGHEARGCADVGRSKAAVALFDLAVAEDASPSNRVNAAAWAAKARAQIGELDGALEGALPVLDQLEYSVTSPRTLKVLGPVRQALQSLPAAAEFRARFDALTSKGQART